MKGVSKWTILSSLVFGIWGSQAKSFTLFNPSAQYTWQMPMQIKLAPANCNMDTDDLEFEIQRAIKFWNSIQLARISISYAGLSTLTEDQLVTSPPTDAVTIFCDTQFSSRGGSGEPSQFAIATGAPGALGSGYGQIRLNMDKGGGALAINFSMDALGRVLMHELGHVLGLGHSGSTKSIMYPNLSSASVPSQDDIEGIVSLYPRNSNSGALLGCVGPAQARDLKAGGLNVRGRVLSVFDAVCYFLLLWIWRRGRRFKPTDPT